MSEVDIARLSARGSFVLFVGNLLSALVSAGAVIIVARLLGPQDYGVYTLVLVVPNVLQAIGGLGITSGITRYSAFHKSRAEQDVARRVMVNGIMFIGFLGALLSLVTFAGGDLLAATLLQNPDLGQLVKLASALVLAQSISQAAIAALLGWGLSGTISITNVVQSGIKLAVATTLILLGYGVGGAVIGYVASLFVASGLALLALFLSSGTKQGNSTALFSSDVKTLLYYGIPLYAGTLASTLVGQYVIVLMASIGGIASIGFYQSASNILVVLGITATATSQALFPAFAYLEGTKGNSQLAFRYAVTYVSVLTVPLVFAIIGASNPLIRAIYGDSYAPAATYLNLLSLSHLPFLLGYTVIPIFLSGIGRTRLVLAFSLINALILAFLSPLLGVLLQLGVDGILYAMVIANFSAAAAGLYLTKRRTSSEMDFKKAGLIALSSFVGYAVIAPLQTLPISPAVLAVALGCIFLAVYLTLTPAVGAVDEADVIRIEIALEGMGRVRSIFQPVLAYEKWVRKSIRR